MSKLFIKIIRQQQKFKPIFSFRGFFKRYLHFSDKIRLTYAVSGFIRICSDGSTAPYDLFGDNTFLFLFGEVLIEFYDTGGKMQRLFKQRIFFHSVDLFLFNE